MYAQLIEQRIASLDGGTFQSLCRELVTKEFSSYVHNTGGVLGSAKTTKGHPDVLFRLRESDRYIFLECGTVKEKIEEKIKNDVLSCLDEEKTGIPCEKIDKIIYCFSGRKIDFVKLRDLSEKLTGQGIIFFIWGIDTLASMIENDCPTIAKQFLGFNLPLSKSIYKIDEFIEDSKNQWSPSLDKNFMYRGDELAKIDSLLQENNILILHGNPGVGKTRLAIEYLKNKSEKSLIIKAEENPPLDEVFESSRKADYFIIDDASETPLLPQILGRLKNKKTILTVRNYSFDETERILSEAHLKHASLYLQPFKGNEIIQIISSNSRIKNQDLLIQISRISNGNIRLGFMVVDSIEKSPEKCRELFNAREIFADYYCGRLNSLLERNDSETLLKIIGILCVLGKCSLRELKEDKTLLEIIGVSKDSFASCIQILNKQEIITILYEDIICIADQCLSNYLSFYVFIQKRLLPLSSIILWSFPRRQKKLVSFLNVLLNIFRDEKDEDFITNEVVSAWQSLSKTGDTILQKEFCARLCLLNISNTAQFISNHVADKENEFTGLIINQKDWRIMALEKIVIKKTKLALELIDKLLLASSVEKEDVAKMIEAAGALNEYSSHDGYVLQKEIISYFLNNRSNSNTYVAKNYCLSILRFQSENAEFDDRTIYFKTITVSGNDKNLAEIRSMAWNLLFECGDFYESLRDYFTRVPPKESDNVFDSDVENINCLLEKLGDKCDSDKELLIFFETRSIFSFLNRSWAYIEEKYSEKIAILKQVFFLDNNNDVDDYRKEEINRASKLDEAVKRLEKDDIFYIFSFLNYTFPLSKCFPFRNNAILFVKLVFNYWASKEVLFGEIDKILSFCNLFSECDELYNHLIDSLAKEKGAEFTYQFLMQVSDANLKSKSICHFLAEVSKNDKKLALKLFSDYLDHFFKPSNYSALKEILWGDFPQDIVSTFVSKLFCNPRQPFPVDMECLFFQKNDFLDFLIKNQINLVEDIYIYVLERENKLYSDYDGETLLKIVKRDKSFFVKYCRWLISKKVHLDYERQVSAIWGLDCYQGLFDDVFQLILNDNKTFLGFCPMNIFGLRMFCNKQSLTDRQFDWIKQYLSKNKDSKTLRTMKIMVWEADDDTKLKFVKIILDLDYSSSDFEICLSEPSCISYSGSYTIVVDNRISFLKRIKSIIPDDLKHLKHITLVEDLIKKLKSERNQILYREALDDRFES